MGVFISGLLGGLSRVVFGWPAIILSLVTSFAIPLLTNTVGKLFFGFGGGIAVYQMGDQLFDYFFSQISNEILNGVPLKALQFAKMIGFDTAINTFVSFLFALAVIKGMDRYGTMKRAAWNRPKDHLPGSGKWEA